MLTKCTGRCLALTLLLIGLTAGAARAAALAEPEGPVILTVTGAVSETNRGGAAVFDRAMLEALGTRSFETTTIWTEGVQSFRGTPLSTLLARLGVTGGEIEATAINDYSVSIPVGDAVPDGPILAFERNGKVMTLRGKGPLWLVYPYDSADAYRTKVIYSRSIWQLDRLHVVP